MPTNDRFHSLDAVRACALLAGIVLHAIMPYMPGWPFSYGSTSPGLGILYFVIHIFRMALFFMIAGFFARLLHERLGTKKFIRNRLQRIALPLIAAFFIVVPLTIISMIWSFKQLGTQSPPNMLSPIPIIGPPIPWAQLWFLYVLLIIYALTLGVHFVVERLDRKNILRAKISSLVESLIKTRIALIVLTAPIALSLFASTWWVQWQGVPSPIMGFIPNFPALLAYGSAFILGWLLHRQQNCLHFFAKDWLIYFVIALSATSIALYIGGITPKFVAITLSDMERAIYAAAYVLAQWCWMFAIVGLAVRYLAVPNTRWRYLADASYWMYLIHLPIVWLLAAWMLRWPLHWSIKLSLVLTITSMILLTSYHYLVRPTFIGKFLNGRKYPRSLSLPIADAERH